MQQKREFTGVWLPRHILEDNKLKPVDRLVYAEIASFKECWHTNTLLAERTGTSEPTISRSVKRLIDNNYIKLVSFNGRNRVLQALFDTPPNQNDEAGLSKRQGRVVKTTSQPTQNEPLDNKEITIRKQEDITAKAEDEIASLYFQVIKKYELPTRNFNNVRSAIDKLKAETSHDQAVSYLTFLLEKYQDINFDFKPELTEALDIHAKRMQIITAVKRTAQKHKKAGVLVI